MAQPVEPGLEFIFEAQVAVDPMIDLGDVGKGRRRVVPITGGSFAGPAIRGEVLPGGADWQIVRSDGTAELEARYTLKTDDGALIYVRNHALRRGSPEIIAALAEGSEIDPARYYFRGATFFEASAKRYAWLSDHIVVCSATRAAAGVVLRFFRVT